MSKFSKLGLRRAAGAVAIASAAIVGIAGMGVGEAAGAPLAKGYKVATGIDGEKLQTWRTQESQYSVKRVAYNGGLGRTAVLSGVYTSKASADVAGKLKVYVIAGCQLDVSNLTLGGGGGLSFDIMGGGVPNLALDGALSIPISLGEAAAVSISSKSFKAGGAASIQLQDFEINFPNCGGYASARTVVESIGAKGYKIEDEATSVSGEGTLLKSTLYGQPFFVS